MTGHTYDALFAPGVLVTVDDESEVVNAPVYNRPHIDDLERINLLQDQWVAMVVAVNAQPHMCLVVGHGVMGWCDARHLMKVYV